MGKLVDITVCGAGGRMGRRIVALAEENGLIIRAMGDSIGFCPPLVINEDEIDDLIGRFRKTLDTALKWAHIEGLVK